VDKYGEPDVRIDLEKGFLPFGDNSCDTVVCLEVLEHVDALHRLFSELVRCSRDVVIVTLPNCWRQMLGELVFGRSSKAEYGLPPEKPRDRHKWFFNTEEAESFVAWQARDQGMEILEVEYVHNIGDLFALSLGLGHKGFFYPPQKHRREMGAFTRFATAFVSLFEKIVKTCLLMVGRRGRNASVVNVWFVLRKK
jgi:SAM-dependent methyltransferase